MIDIEMDVTPSSMTPTVLIGSGSCDSVHTYTTTYTPYASETMHVVCNVTDMPPGTWPLTVNLPDIGDAASNLTMTTAPAIVMRARTRHTGHARA